MFGARERSGSPIAGAVHELTHALEPPPSGAARGVPRERGGKTGKGEAELELRIREERGGAGNQRLRIAEE